MFFIAEEGLLPGLLGGLEDFPEDDEDGRDCASGLALTSFAFSSVSSCFPSFRLFSVGSSSRFESSSSTDLEGVFGCRGIGFLMSPPVEPVASLSASGSFLFPAELFLLAFAEDAADGVPLGVFFPLLLTITETSFSFSTSFFSTSSSSSAVTFFPLTEFGIEESPLLNILLNDAPEVGRDGDLDDRPEVGLELLSMSGFRTELLEDFGGWSVF